MIKISQKEFEDKVRSIINGECTRNELIKELKTDKVTLNNKIQELSIENPDLYLEFILKFPYRPRKYTHIDYEAMAIDIMKRGYSSRQAEDEYGISRKTIKRNVEKLEQKNPRLYQLYSAVMHYRKIQCELPENIQSEIVALESKEVFIGGICDQRESELLKIEKEFIESRMAGLSDSKAHGPSARAEKRLSTLYRIKMEQAVNHQLSAKEVSSPKNRKRANNPGTTSGGPEDR